MSLVPVAVALPITDVPDEFSPDETPPAAERTHDRDMAADFSALAYDAVFGPTAGTIGRSVRRALAQGSYHEASGFVSAAIARYGMDGYRIADLTATMAAVLFYRGAHAKAAPFADMAAKADQPLGLWIQGLIAYGQTNWSAATRSFATLADHAALNPEQRAAAHFWAARAESQRNRPKAAERHLEQAVTGGSGGFYGILAAQKLGRADPLSYAKGLTPARYALPVWKPEGGFRVDRALIFALARQESRLDPAAISHRGAHGLMQIMPATAGAQGEDLLDPETNLTMGQNYLRRLATRRGIDGNLLLMLAAYNSGPGKVARWDAAATKDPLWFLETIPVRETRTYIARVLPHYWAYRASLNQSLSSLAALAKGRWPRETFTDTVREADEPVRIASAAP